MVPAPAAAFFSQSLDVVILLDKPSYGVGDTVTATVDVISDGILSDPGSVGLELNVSGTVLWARPVALVRVGPGTYAGSFQVLANMTPPSRQLMLLAQASVGSLSGGSSQSVTIVNRPVLTDHGTLSAYEAAPGQSVNGTLQTFLDGALADVDNLTMLAVLNVGGRPVGVFEPAVRNVSAGTYGFSYTVPSALNQSGIVFFTAYARVLALNNSTSGLSNLPPLRIDVANPFLVWVHTIGFTSNQTVAHAAFDLWVADPSGRAVAGARVWVRALSAISPAGGTVTGVATTDASGRASLDLAMRAFTGLWTLPLTVSVQRGSANQSLFTFLAVSPPPTPGFTVQRQNPQDLFEPGETAVLDYTAYYDGVAYKGTDILYTAYTGSSLVAYGRVTTDLAGAFRLNFTMPSDPVTIELETQRLGSVIWSDATLTVSPSQRLAVQVGALQLGTTGHIVATLPASGGPWSVTIAFYPANASAPPDFAAGWVADPELTGLGVRLGVQAVAGPTVDLAVPLPAFLPTGPYYLEILVSSADLASPFTIPLAQYAYVALVTVQPAPPDAVLLLVVTVPIVAAVVLTAFVVQRRRKRLRPPETKSPPPPAP